MKNASKTKKHSLTSTQSMTLCDLIASAYSNCGTKGTAKLLQLAMQTGVVTYAAAKHF
jgi:hypothetical protein